MDVVRQHVTADELLHMPDDGFRYELVREDLRRTTPAGSDHGRIVVRITWRLARHVEENGLGNVYAETGFKLATNPDTVRAPDAAFVSRDRGEAVGKVEGFWPEAPQLAIEVISPGDSYADVEEKVFDWLDAGTKMVVVINPRQRSATVYKSPTDIGALAEADVLDAADVVPGFELAVRDIFA
jgi:Uma2 family endonuclease